MKLRNKLIPLLATAATASVVAPLAVTMTSCSEWMRMYDLKDGVFQPDTFQLDKGRLNQFEATSNYVDECKARPRSFVQDVMYGQSSFVHTMLAQYYGDDITLTKFDMGVSKPTFGTAVTWGLGEEDWTYPTLSFRQQINLELEYTDYISATKTRKTILSMDIGAEYRDVIFYAVCNVLNAKGSWKIGMFDDSTWFSDTEFDDSLLPYIHDTKPWSVDYNIDVHETRITEDKTTQTTDVYQMSWNRNDHMTDAITLQEFRNLWWIDEASEVDLLFAAASRLVIFNYDSYFLELISPSFDIRQQEKLNIYTSPSQWTSKDQVVYLDGIIMNNVLPDVGELSNLTVTLVPKTPEDPKGGNISFIQDPNFLADDETIEDLRTIETVVDENNPIQLWRSGYDYSPNIVHVRIPAKMTDGDIYTTAPEIGGNPCYFIPFNTQSKALYFWVECVGRDPVQLTCYLNYSYMVLDLTY